MSRLEVWSLSLDQCMLMQMADVNACASIDVPKQGHALIKHLLLSQLHICLLQNEKIVTSIAAKFGTERTQAGQSHERQSNL